MPDRKIDTKRARKLLKQLDLKRLFVEELNWANSTRRPSLIPAGGEEYSLTPIAEQGGMVVFEAASKTGDGIPDRSARLAVHQKLLEHAHEHILVFVNRARTTTQWVWVERQGGKRVRDYHHRFHIDQPGDSLLQKLEGMAFDWKELDEEGRASIIQVGDKVRAALAVEKVTKRFYDEFKAKHQEFLGFIAGVEKLDDRRWYASVMLNRLMFLYFIQRKGFLAGDSDYLRNHLDVCRLGGVPYYRGFLVPLFFEGLGMRPEERPAATASLLGKIPYLDGGLFMPHQIEQAHDGIDIPDEAFERLFGFFDRYQWHLDTREDHVVRADNEINPDVLGYIFEKYINQKEMGAYYTREDITEYISKNTVLPFLFDKLKGCGPACEAAVAPLRIADIEGYIHDALRTGLDLELPARVAAGLEDVSQRGCWNQPADADYALPTETWREHVARRKRVEQIRADFAAGKIASINDLITCNLDIIAFTHDFIDTLADPSVLHAFYFRCLKQVTVLDPTCGSGAFLFAALNLLEPLYDRCLARMADFVSHRAPVSGPARTWKGEFAFANEVSAQKSFTESGSPAEDALDAFQAELESLAKHPSRPYFIYKSIIVQNLYGVDIMQEAVEICKLRLFLKLAAQVEPDPAKENWGIEPLPDIDFNILCGNTLVGYVRLEDIDRLWATVERGTTERSGAFAFEKDHSRLAELCREYGRMLGMFRDQQLGLPTPRAVTKADVQRAADMVRPELDKDLWRIYRQAGLVPDKTKQKEFQASHQPLHWVLEFPAVMGAGGFDVIIGNPPWVEFRRSTAGYGIIGYESHRCNNLWAYVTERSLDVLRLSARCGLIVPMALVCTERMVPIQRVIEHSGVSWLSSYESDSNPGQLFEQVKQNVSILLHVRGEVGSRYTTRLQRFFAEARPFVFYTVQYVQDVPHYTDFGFPKVGEPMEATVLEKLFGHPPLSAQLDPSGGKPIFVHRIAHYYIKCLDFIPYFKSTRDGVKKSEDYKEYWFRQPVGPLVAAVNSSLFYLYWQVFYDAFKAGKQCVEGFPCAPFADSAVARRLGDLAVDLMRDMKANSTRLRARYAATGDVEYDQFYPRLSKPIMDQIDRVLAEHYGFTDEELDFIINYDIKYRMGGSAGEEEE